MTKERAIELINDDIHHMKQHLTEKGKAEEFYQELGDMVIASEMAISALEKQREGHWIKVEDNGKILSYQCSCGCSYKNNYNFCPNCGAKMTE